MVKKQAENEAYQRLKADLKAGTLRACYLLYGEEGYLRDYYCERMRKKLLQGPAEAFNYHRFSRENLDWNQVAAAVEAVPMLAERSLVEVDDVDPYQEPAGAREQITALLEDLPDHCCLVFRFDTVPFRPDKRLKRLHAAVSAHAQAVEFQKQSGPELRAWTRRQALAAGKDMDNAACDHLAFLTDHSLQAMASELQKLTAYAEGPLITRQDIDAVVEPTLTAVSFDISNAVAGGDYERALGKLRDLLAMQQDPILLLGAVASQLRRLLCAKVLSEHGRGAEALQRLCGLGSYPARLAMDAARRMRREFCERAVLLCLETDRQLKTSYDDPRRLLELLLIRLAGEAGT
ncbi:MAG: DNA polymerase III subunit delta [Oscillospiraceae bacterium]|nr:DNA polymerase III subunit delta [Oscillospiraceae bacterium]